MSDERVSQLREKLHCKEITYTLDGITSSTRPDIDDVEETVHRLEAAGATVQYVHVGVTSTGMSCRISRSNLDKPLFDVGGPDE